LIVVVIELLRNQGRVPYRTLKYLFGIDETVLEEIREDLGFRQLARDENGQGLVWTGEAQPVSHPVMAITRPSALPDAITATSPLLLDAETDTPSNRPTAPPEGMSAAQSNDPTVDAAEPILTAPEAERRQLTVMFCDLADSTRLSQQLDPEDLRDVVRAYQATAAEVIEQYEGHMAQYLGDGLLIYFGWPVANEDDAQRAAHAGLGIVQAITTTLNPRLQQEKGVQLTIRLGVHTGPVVVGEMGGGGRHENLATGETVNIAARLEELATPNTMIISSVTARLVERSFILENLGRHALKGVAELMPVFRVLNALEVDQDEEATTPVNVTLVGRDEELGLLLRRWEQAKEGLGQVVLVSDESGIGKSSLVETLCAQVVCSATAQEKERLERVTMACRRSSR
jgi:class 3 adenylate cyclase